MQTFSPRKTQVEEQIKVNLQSTFVRIDRCVKQVNFSLDTKYSSLADLCNRFSQRKNWVRIFTLRATSSFCWSKSFFALSTDINLGWSLSQKRELD